MAKEKKKPSEGALPFGRTNYILMAAALVCVVIGFIALGSGSITLAPILLVVGYCVLFPLGIILGVDKKKAEVEKQDGSQRV